MFMKWRKVYRKLHEHEALLLRAFLCPAKPSPLEHCLLTLQQKMLLRGLGQLRQDYLPDSAKNTSLISWTRRMAIPSFPSIGNRALLGEFNNEKAYFAQGLQ